MSVSQHIKKMLEYSNKKSLWSFLTSWEFGKIIVDGNVGHNLVIKPSDGTLVGTDYHGNRYFENPHLAYGRKRWVVYSNVLDYSPSSVPPEWHGWLNHINDYAPPSHDFKAPAFAVPATQTNTGTAASYAPKGSWKNPAKRDWLKYQAWTPPTSQ